MDGYARANQQKPSGIEAKVSILRRHLAPMFGDVPLDDITTEAVQQLKAAMKQEGLSAKTLNNTLTVLNKVLRTAVEWKVIDSMPCVIRLLKAPKPTAPFHDPDAFERLVGCAQEDGPEAYVTVLLGGEAGLRCGEIMALEWDDVDLGRKPQITVARSQWCNHVTATKGGRVRQVDLTVRLAEALRSLKHDRGPRVLCDADGQPFTQKMIYGLVRRVARRANVSPVFTC